MKRPLKNVAASVHTRLIALSRERQLDANYVQLRYAMECLLHRMAVSRHAASFTLKGAALYWLWEGVTVRPTRDLDLLGSGSSDIEHLENVMREICNISLDEDDGVVFVAEEVRGSRIKEDDLYQGVRLNVMARIGNSRIPFHVDVGFGDIITPQPLETELLGVLGTSMGRLRAYPRESVIAEKFHAMTLLGAANSRLKDFYDLWFLGRNFRFEEDVVSTAIRATFERRGTALPTTAPLALTDEFYSDPKRANDWRAFLRRMRRENEVDFPAVGSFLQAFIGPLLPGLQPVGKARAWEPPRTIWQ